MSASSDKSSAQSLGHILRHVQLGSCSIGLNEGNKLQANHSAHQVYFNSQTAHGKSTVIAFDFFLLLGSLLLHVVLTKDSVVLVLKCKNFFGQCNL